MTAQSARTMSSSGAQGADAALGSITLVRPAHIRFGWGEVGTVGEWAQARGLGRVLVVSDSFNARRVDALALDGDIRVFSKVKPEPDIPNFEALRQEADAFGPDLIVGFGGGSAMDLAKLASVLLGTGTKVHDVAGPGRAGVRSVRLVQVPTTAGTGSEAGIRSLVTDPETRNKVAVESLNMLADLAVIDPELTTTIPPAVTAATGVDALAHCVEAYTSARAHPMIDIYAEQGITLVGRFLARAVGDGTDRDARNALALASLCGGYCLGPVNTTAGHAVSYPLGTRHSIPHGLANAVVFPHVLAFNQSAASGKTRFVAERLGLDETDIFGSAYRFCESLGVEMRLSALGVPHDDLPAMADEASGIRRLLDFNPRAISRDEILGMYEAAY